MLGTQMQFPITREALQTFDSEAAWKVKHKQQRYDFYRVLIQDICKDIETGMMGKQDIIIARMGFPQNYKPQTMQMELALKDTVKDKRFVWKHIGILGCHWHIFNSPEYLNRIQKIGGPVQYYKQEVGRNPPNAEQLNQALPEFIEMLKETFIGCDIIVDPLKTYLIIDWS